MTQQQPETLMSKDVDSEEALNDCHPIDKGGAAKPLVVKTSGRPSCSYGTLAGAELHGLEHMFGFVMEELDIQEGIAQGSAPQDNVSQASMPDGMVGSTSTLTNKPPTTPPSQAGTPRRRSLPADHFLSNTPAVHIPDPAVLDALGIDRPPTPFPRMESTLQRQPSYSNHSNHQLEAAYRLSPKLPAPDPSDPIFSSPSHSPKAIVDYESTSSSDLDEIGTMSLHEAKPVKREDHASLPTQEDEAPKPSTCPNPKKARLNFNYIHNSVTQAYVCVANVLENLPIDQHGVVLYKLNKHYEERVGGEPVLERQFKTDNPAESEKLTTTKLPALLQKMQELIDNLERLEKESWERAHRSKEVLMAFQADYARLRAAHSSALRGEEDAGETN